MILGKDIHPERKVYYWGALVIEILNSQKEGGASYFSVYEELKESHDVSAEMFSLALDWLFILGAIDGEKGYIKKCF